MPRLLKALALLLALSSVAAADIQLTGNVKTLLKSNVTQQGYFLVTLQNCSPGPSIAGSVLDTSAWRNQYPVDNQGNATFRVYWNDTEVSCAGAFTSYYTVSFVSAGKTVWSKNFQFLHTAATADLSTYQEFNSTPPSPSANYAVRSGGNTFTGTQDFGGATVIGLSTSKPRRFLPAGTMDGANKDFLFGAFPTDHAEFALYWNGMQLTETDDYTVSGTTVTMTKAPKSGDHLVAYF